MGRTGPKKGRGAMGREGRSQGDSRHQGMVRMHCLALLPNSVYLAKSSLGKLLKGELL